MQEQIGEECANNQNQFIRAFLRSYSSRIDAMNYADRLDSRFRGNDGG
jgi:hypothetical protein